MPLPPDDKLDATIGEQYDSILSRASEPGQFGIVTAEAAKLQAVSVRRLVVALDNSSRSQASLQRIGIWIAYAGVALAVLQAIAAVLSLTK